MKLQDQKSLPFIFEKNLNLKLQKLFQFQVKKNINLFLYLNNKSRATTKLTIISSEICLIS